MRHQMGQLDHRVGTVGTNVQYLSATLLDAEAIGDHGYDVIDISGTRIWFRYQIWSETYVA
jgi:hypothetical protein